MEETTGPEIHEVHVVKKNSVKVHRFQTIHAPKIPHARHFLSAYFLLIAGAIIIAGVYSWQHKKVVSLQSTVTTQQAQIKSLQKQNLTLSNLENAPEFSPDFAVGKKFSGIITADGCATSKLPVGDVGCSITIGSSTSLQVIHGNFVQKYPWGSFNYLGTNPTGKVANIYAHQIDKNSYTLEGSTSYYVKTAN